MNSDGDGLGMNPVITSRLELLMCHAGADEANESVDILGHVAIYDL